MENELLTDCAVMVAEALMHHRLEEKRRAGEALTNRFENLFRLVNILTVIDENVLAVFLDTEADGTKHDDLLRDAAQKCHEST